MESVKVNGVTCIKGEIHSILTIMRLNTRWSLSNRHLKESLQDESPLVHSFRRLNEYLEGMFDLREVDCMMYLSPFHQVVISDQASGPLTSAALASLSKFALYGFLSQNFPRSKEGIALIASCISRCIFEETDWESDEVILMKLLELSVLVFRCDASCLLTVGAAWDIYSTCISIHGQHRASKILRSEAETALRHLTMTAFSRARQALKSFHSKEDNNNTLLDDHNDFGFSQLMKMSKSWETVSQKYLFDGPMGVTLFLGKVMSVLCSLMDMQSQAMDKVQFALSLVNIALEAGGPSLGSMGPLVDILRGDICRHLLKASQSDDLTIFSLTLRVVFNLFVSIKDHMKVQLEVFLTSVHLRLLAQSTAASVTVGSCSAKEELALESLLEFCREPSLMQDLYTNYDCDVQCTNLFDAIINVLCARALPANIRPTCSLVTANSPTTASTTSQSNSSSGQSPPGGGEQRANGGRSTIKTSVLNRLALDGVLCVLHSVSGRCCSVKQPVGSNNQIFAAGGCDGSGSNDSSPVKEKFSQWVDEDDGSRSRSMSDMENILSLDQGIGLDIDCVATGVSKGAANDDNSPSAATTPTKDHGLDMASHRPSLSSFSSTDSFVALATSPVASKVSSMSQSGGGECMLMLTEDDDDSLFVMQARARTAEVLRQRKLKKQRLRLVAEKFNEAPLKSEWMKFAVQLGVAQAGFTGDLFSELIFQSASANKSVAPIAPTASQLRYLQTANDLGRIADVKSLARYLRHSPGVGKIPLGEFLGKGPADMFPFHALALESYLETFDFAGENSTFDNALRLFLGTFRLPGEAQCIDRLMEAFAKRYFECIGPGKPFKSADAAFVFAFSTIMLNTDLHNPQISTSKSAKRMTLEDFMRNNKGLNDKDDFPAEYQEKIYDAIKAKQIQVVIDVSDSAMTAGGGVDYCSDTAAWNKLISKSAADQAPAAFTPTITARGMNCGKSSLFLSTAHEKDMFLVMAKPILDTLMTLLEKIDTDTIISRLFVAIWEYGLLCSTLELHELKRNLVHLLAAKSWEMMTTSRFNNLLDPRIHAEIDHKELRSCLDPLMSAKLDQLISAQRLSPSEMINNTPSPYNWKYCHLLKGEILFKLVFGLVTNDENCLDSNCWLEIIHLLLWCRSRGVLSCPLAHIYDGSDILYSHPVALSRFALSCHSCAMRKPSVHENGDVSDSSRNQASLWQSVTSLGGLLWTSNLDSSSSATGGTTAPPLLLIESLDGNTSPYTPQQVGIGFTRLDDDMLRVTIASTNADHLLFVNAKDLTDQCLDMLMEAMTNNLNEVLSSLLSSDSKSEEYVELDAVVQLQWICTVFNANIDRAWLLWPRLHNIFVRVLQEEADVCLLVCPYVLERCVHLIFSSAGQLMPTSSAINTNSLDSRNSLMTSAGAARLLSSRGSPMVSHLTLKLAQPESCNLWPSLCLVRSLSARFLVEFGDQLGADLQSIIIFSPGVSAFNTMDEWLVLFSLLSNVAAADKGRAFSWDVLAYLVDNNLVTAGNFTSCRHLALRYLHGVFASDSDESEQHMDEYAAFVKRQHTVNPYLSLAMMLLLKLTCMALAGYTSSTSSRTISESDRLDTLVQARQQSLGQFAARKSAKTATAQSSSRSVSFAMPAWFESTDTKEKPLNSRSGSTIVRSPASDNSVAEVHYSSINEQRCHLHHQPYYATHMTVTALSFATSDVDMLWVESCSALADLCSHGSARISSRATFCIQMLVNIAIQSQLPSALWIHQLHDLLTSLPVAMPLSDPRQQQIKDIESYCLRNCNAIFEILLSEFKRFRDMSDFQGVWLKFISILAANLEFVNRKQPVHDEMLEMIGALLRLMRVPALPILATASPLPHAGRSPHGLPPSQPNASKPMATPSYGLFGFLFGASGPAPPVTPSSLSPGEGTAAPHRHQQAEEPPPPVVTVATLETPQAGSEEACDDSALLTLSWNTLCTVSPSFKASMKVKNSQLLVDILKNLEAADMKTVASSSQLKHSGGVSGDSEASLSITRQVPLASAQSTNSNTKYVNNSPGPVNSRNLPRASNVQIV